MKYKELVDKLAKYEREISEDIAKDPGVETVPADLESKREAAEAWLKEADIKLGSAEVAEMVPNIDPILDYSTKLDYYSKMFDEKVQSKITEFAELVKELFEEVKA